jgi:hypothetical protein
MKSTKVITALDAVVATTTSNKFFVGGAKRIAFLFRRAAHSAGSSLFTVNIGLESEDTVTPTMTATNMLIDDLTNTNTQNLTRVANHNLAANGDAILYLDPVVLCNWISVTVTQTTDGTHSAWIVLEY